MISLSIGIKNALFSRLKPDIKFLKNLNINITNKYSKINSMITKSALEQYLRVGPSSYAALNDCHGPSADTVPFSLWVRHAISLEFAYYDRSSWEARLSIRDDWCWRTIRLIW